MYYNTDILFFFFNDTATTEIYPLSLHDALPIYQGPAQQLVRVVVVHVILLGRSIDLSCLHVYRLRGETNGYSRSADRKSTRLNSSHANISYAVFCLKKKKINSPNTNISNNIHML